MNRPGISQPPLPDVQSVTMAALLQHT